MQRAKNEVEQIQKDHSVTIKLILESFSAVKQLLNKNRRLSISLDPNHT